MKNTVSIILILLFKMIIYGQPAISTVSGTKVSTICNPLNLSYRFGLDAPSRREAADPVVVLFKEEYYLFASKTGGYWHSTDLVNWNLITTQDLNLEDYAPGAAVIGDAIYFMASTPSPAKIFKTSDPKSGKWEVANDNFPIGMVDPTLFSDEDGRLYFYYGCSNENPIYAVELDPVSMNPIGKTVACLNSQKENYGWEQNGDYNNLDTRPWIEGAWMTKYEGKYYLQYAGPGTEFKSYSDGLYVSDQPLGPFQVADHNPISLKPEGFVAGAGHGSTFQDKYGNFWHIATMTISQKHPFERRLGLFPMFFDKDGTLYTYTGFGDFPFRIPNKKITGPEELFPEWMLLSYNKPVEVSSELTEHPNHYSADEEIRTYWSAKSGEKGEWITIDLQQENTIHAVQLNFAENQTQVLGRNPEIFYQYLLEYSSDKINWKTLEDKTFNKTDVPHDFVALSTPVKARYVRLTNYHVPDGTFALAGLRVFGKGSGKNPAVTQDLNLVRTQSDRREVNLKWKKSPDAVGYNIRYGSHPEKLYHNHQVLGSESLKLRSLNTFQKYYFTIDTFNENGITKGTKIVEVK